MYYGDMIGEEIDNMKATVESLRSEVRSNGARSFEATQETVREGQEPSKPISVGLLEDICTSRLNRLLSSAGLKTVASLGPVMDVMNGHVSMEIGQACAVGLAAEATGLEPEEVSGWVASPIGRVYYGFAEQTMPGMGMQQLAGVALGDFFHDACERAKVPISAGLVFRALGEAGVETVGAETVERVEGLIVAAARQGRRIDMDAIRNVVCECRTAEQPRSQSVQVPAKQAAKANPDRAERDARAQAAKAPDRPCASKAQAR